MDLVEVDIVGAEPFQAGLAGLDDVLAAGAEIVDPVPHAGQALGGDQHLLTDRAQNFAEQLFRLAIGIDIGGVEQVDA